MNIVFRTDASIQIGTGHIMRCLTLAEALRGRGAECLFICRKHKGHLLEHIRQRGFDVRDLPVLGSDWATDLAQTKNIVEETKVDWLVVDHYELDARWESSMRQICRRLMVIDDLANRPHDCDILLDQNFYRNQEQRYQGLLMQHSKTLLGPAYILLRTEFDKVRQELRTRDGIVKRIIIFFGGSDPKNQTLIVLATLKKMNMPNISVDVVVGYNNPNRYFIQMLCKQITGITFHCNISNMAELILNADLGIGAGGSAMWERCYLGLPTITVVFAENQLRTTEDVAYLGAIEYLGWADSLGVNGYERAISGLISNPQRLKQISETALALIQRQTTSSVADEMLNFR